MAAHVTAIAGAPAGPRFLTLKDFLSYFPPIKMTKAEFAKQFIVAYSHPLTLEQACSLNPPGRKPIVKGPQDLRYVNRDAIVDYFYEIIITNRHHYLSLFYRSFFDFGDPRDMKWGDVLIAVGDDQISLQKNDRSRIMVRNLFYLEILHLTRVTNTAKSRTSFWETLDNMYNKLRLEDRFFAPSSIGLFLREKRKKQPTKEINYNNLFYLIQQYQPKASILNPYSIKWILSHVLDQTGAPGQRLLTPVLSWGSYLIAYMHSPQFSEYVGIDVMPSTCQKVEYLGQYYHQLSPEFKRKSVEVHCRPSEALARDAGFLRRYKDYFDVVVMCPPYWTFELYHEGDQSVKLYPTYQSWLERYWRPTVELAYHCLKKGHRFAFIINDFNDLQGREYHLIDDMTAIAGQQFREVGRYFLVNRMSPLRMNFKERTERLCVYEK